MPVPSRDAWLDVLSFVVGTTFESGSATGRAALPWLCATRAVCSQLDAAVGRLLFDTTSAWRDGVLVDLSRHGRATALCALADARGVGFASDTAASKAVFTAALHGHATVLRALARPQFGLGPGHAVRAGTGAAKALSALVLACGSGGSVDAVDALAEPPFCQGRDAAHENNCCALVWAAQNGHTSVVVRLAQPPFSIAGDNERVKTAIVAAMLGGHTTTGDAITTTYGVPLPPGETALLMQLTARLAR